MGDSVHSTEERFKSVFTYGHIDAFCSSYTGTTLNLTSLEHVKRCQEEQGYRGFERHREHLYDFMLAMV